jgi:hypothetical protein
MARDHQLIPEINQLIDVDDPSDILLGALQEDLFIDPGSISTDRKVVATLRAAPPNVRRQYDHTRRLRGSPSSRFSGIAGTCASALLSRSIPHTGYRQPQSIPME